jgi:hypothetical protein
MDECFPLNGNQNDPNVKVKINNYVIKGVDGLLQAYHKSLDFVVLSGPTFLKKVV